jgi:hypothetical protein
MSPTKTKTRMSISAKAAAVGTAPSAATSKYAVGDDVAHPQFGDGTVTDIEGDKLTISFVDGRVKQILDYYVNAACHNGLRFLYSTFAAVPTKSSARYGRIPTSCKCRP